MFHHILQRMSGMVRHLRQRFQKTSGKPVPKTRNTTRARTNRHKSIKRKHPVRVVKKS